MKQASRVGTADARGLRDVATLLARPLLCSFVLSEDRSVRELLPGVTAVPSAWALGPATGTA